MKRSLTVLLLTTFLGVSMAQLKEPFGSKPKVAMAQSVTGQMVVNKAMKYLGYPYSYTGATPQTGFSCIGFVSYVFQSLGIAMPGDLADVMAIYPRVAESHLLPGDIIFFQNTWWKGVSHVAIYTGNGRMVHAENRHRGVTTSYLRNDGHDGNYWQQHYLVAERPLTGEPITPPPTGSPKVKRWVTVSVPSLNLRGSPSLNAPIETVLRHGTRLGVLGERSGWFNVEMDGATFGWVIMAGVTGSGGTKSGGSTRLQGLPATVSVHGLHVHDQPAVGAAILDTLSLGNRVRVLKQTPGWDRLRVSDSLVGWSVNWGLKLDAGKAPTGKKPKLNRQRKLKTYPVVPDVRIHSGPALTASVVTYTTPGMTVEVLGEKSGFAHVQTPSHFSGWIVASFVQGLRRVPRASHHPKIVRHPSHSSGHAGELTITAHLRSGPSLYATIIQWVPVGTHLTLLRMVPNWDLVRLPTKAKGYIWSAYIKA